MRDSAVVALGVAVTIFCPRDIAIVGGMAVGHFFLFCNVFRIRRKAELIWVAIFSLLAISTLAIRIPNWPITIGLSLTCAAALIAIEARHPSYHGIAWQYFNPKLPDWWRNQNQPNQTLEPTPTAVMPRAGARVTPASVVAHL